MNPILSRISGWAHRYMPKREDLEHNRWVGPLARRHELWRFTRRSVPRGVAAGLLVGIFALIPGVQIVGAALMCVPCRGNIPLAAAMTFLSMPLTTPFILIGAAWTANRFGFHVDLETVRSMMANGTSLRDWGYWFLSDAAPGVLFGLAVIAVVAAAIGYLVSLWLWTWWIRHKRKVALERIIAERTAG